MTDGILLIDKPANMTSHDVVDRVRKIYRTRKVGHAGTLDPAATGLLPLLIGRYTKLSAYFLGCDKSYLGHIAFGIRTDTMDAEGEIIQERQANVQPEAFEAALQNFRGEIEQLPPMYSAKKINGKKLYELARQGLTPDQVEREAKQVTIHRLECTSFSKTGADVHLTCSSGTYVRVLADDLGEALGCGAHLKSLRRTEVGGLHIDNAYTLDALAEDAELAQKALLAPVHALTHLPHVHISKGLGLQLVQGHQISVDDLRHIELPTRLMPKQNACLLLDDGTLVGIASALIDTDTLLDQQRSLQALKTERILATRL